MLLAVIKTGGKQYLVEPGKKIKIDPPKVLRALWRAGDSGSKEIIFDDVLLLENEKGLEIGKPKIEGAKVIANVLKEGKAKKIIVFKYKAKKRYKVKKGHRQKFLEVEIQKI